MYSPMHWSYTMHHVTWAGIRQEFAQITQQQELSNTYLDTHPFDMDRKYKQIQGLLTTTAVT